MNIKFLGSLSSLSQNESMCKTLHTKTSFIFMKMKRRCNTFSFEWFYTKNCFHIEGRGNLITMLVQQISLLMQ